MKTKEEIEQAITFLRNKGILGSGNTVWQVRFADGKLFDIVELMAEFANPKWISVKEQKPLTDEIIHVWHRNALKKGKRCIVGNNELWHYEGESRLSYEAPTHWMPLPKSPEHLFIGTHKDNTDDMIKKGRDNFGGKYKKLQPPKQSCPQCKTEYTKEELLTNEHCFKCGFEMKGF